MHSPSWAMAMAAAAAMAAAVCPRHPPRRPLPPWRSLCWATASASSPPSCTHATPWPYDTTRRKTWRSSSDCSAGDRTPLAPLLLTPTLLLPLPLPLPLPLTLTSFNCVLLAPVVLALHVSGLESLARCNPV
eukprot:scaffold18172_cov43-Phaeocystis_antarctica.AAC.1